MSSSKFDERSYPKPEMWRNRPVGEQDDELMAREQYEQDQREEDDGDRTQH